jgi:hypothetical protein
MMTDDAQCALRDMVELEMYLVMQPQQKPCPMLPRRTKPLLGARKPHCNPIESSAAAELMDGKFIEPTSNQTFVVSKSGYEYYQRELKETKPKPYAGGSVPDPHRS